MMQLYFYLFFLYIYHCECIKITDGWGAVTIHCRDNEARPVDWWFIYKPPSGVYNLYDDGRNFTYLTSNDFGRYQTSRVPITGHNMLRNTLSPLYRKTYRDHMGAALYSSRGKGRNATVAYGVIMTDVIGGIWLSHTVPGFPNVNERNVLFPEEELDNGHLFLCLSTSFNQYNKILQAVKRARPDTRYVFVSNLFNKWDNERRLADDSNGISVTNISTRRGQNVLVLSRPPGDPNCLYRQFAQSNGIVLDVYGQANSKLLYTICSKKYSVRNIESISLKYPNEVYYIKDKIDRSRWAVSTAAHWQRRGASATPSYWTCTSNLDKHDDVGKGGLMICVQHYGIWLNFDKLKVAEPECYKH